MISKTVNIDVDVRYNIKAGGMSLKEVAHRWGELKRLCDEATHTSFTLL